MRYIVFESSVVGSVEGSVASEGYVTLSKRQVHSWNGLLITNSSIGVIAAGAFNLTHFVSRVFVCFLGPVQLVCLVYSICMYCESCVFYNNIMFFMHEEVHLVLFHLLKVHLMNLVLLLIL